VSEVPSCFGRYGWRDGYESWERNLVHRMKQRLGVASDTPSPCINSCPHRLACRVATADPLGLTEKQWRDAGAAASVYTSNYHDAKTQYAKEHPHGRALRKPDARDQTRVLSRRDEARARGES